MSALLQNLGEVTDFQKYELGRHFEDHQFRNEFGEEATYPQIAIGLRHIGSMKEALQYMSERGMFL
jgi:hypothetical protein|tara:strand:- start:502 stop:699 length:198 start_codon:yes stop_codon:yes gene_type:complete